MRRISAVLLTILRFPREWLWKPVLRILDRAGVTPTILSIGGVATTLLLPIGFKYSSHLLVVVYLLNVFCISADGSLARLQSRTTPQGAYLDLVVAQASFIATIFVVQWYWLAGSFWVLLYTTSYLLLMAHFVAMNAKGIPPSFPVMRTNYLLFLLVVLFQFGVIDIPWLTLFFKIAGIYYALFVLVYIFLFRWMLAVAGKTEDGAVSRVSNP